MHAREFYNWRYGIIVSRTGPGAHLRTDAAIVIVRRIAARKRDFWNWNIEKAAQWLPPVAERES